MQIIASAPARLPLSEVGSFARRIEDLGYDVLHVPETVHDPFTVAALAVTRTTRLVVRTSMVVAFPRSPMVTAYAAWDLTELSGGRFQLGIASQVRGNIVGRFSTPWSEPVARLRDYVGSLRAIFHSFQTGADLDYTGSHYRFERLQPYFNPGPIDHPAPPIWTGGVNERMCVLAGEVSDGFVCHPTSSHPRMLDHRIRPALARGARTAGRTGQGPALVVAPQPLLAATPGELAQVREERRPELGFLYSTPAYRRQLEEFGLGEVGEALSETARRKDWTALAAHMSDEVIGMLVPQGTYDQMPSILAGWYAGRCSGIVLKAPDSTGEDQRYRRLISECRDIPATAAS
ncbi:TIGR03617 family F420-dependent LLM class oxidoreductase [Actinomadura sp. BRA 177]|uniref:TIGR03617 family F420-dependent LLM class oxidoreductase n=1 Tax=Actinomadura sp. BRA 177 TaxID=2745202 RepID=UPI0015963D2A|nr:TIGR03617 family F420-dependent LLM class oxidoreductase [Actinomadura sp. BRA 177]NVI86222.1 TIGR03617 family F420-dependent LLM class oxidoreductase [Actinomadura sp. BRA 177]NVI86235.1 TIGR03617 family F420-dependent LLM class oxidoreductase [Actinomadura sp. BRA 177]